MPEKGKSGDFKQPKDNNDEKHLPQKRDIKPLRHIQDITDVNGTSSSSPHTRKLGDTTLGDDARSSTFDETWQVTQTTGLLKEFRTRHNAGLTGELGKQEPGITKELRAEATQTLKENQDITPITEIPRDDITSQKSLSSEKKAKNRQIERGLYEDRRMDFMRSKL